MSVLIYRPIITEKMTTLQDKYRQYSFEVDPRANKVEIVRAIEKKFNVTVVSVRSLVQKGKAKAQLTRRGRFQGRTKHWKKAIVTLKEGDKIELFENV